MSTISRLCRHTAEHTIASEINRSSGPAARTMKILVYHLANTMIKAKPQNVVAGPSTCHPILIGASASCVALAGTGHLGLGGILVNDLYS